MLSYLKTEIGSMRKLVCFKQIRWYLAGAVFWGAGRSHAEIPHPVFGASKALPLVVVAPPKPTTATTYKGIALMAVFIFYPEILFVRETNKQNGVSTDAFQAIGLLTTYLLTCLSYLCAMRALKSAYYLSWLLVLVAVRCLYDQVFLYLKGFSVTWFDWLPFYSIITFAETGWCNYIQSTPQPGLTQREADLLKKIAAELRFVGRLYSEKKNHKLKEHLPSCRWKILKYYNEVYSQPSLSRNRAYEMRKLAPLIYNIHACWSLGWLVVWRVAQKICLYTLLRMLLSWKKESLTRISAAVVVLVSDVGITPLYTQTMYTLPQRAWTIHALFIALLMGFHCMLLVHSIAFFVSSATGGVARIARLSIKLYAYFFGKYVVESAYSIPLNDLATTAKYCRVFFHNNWDFLRATYLLLIGLVLFKLFEPIATNFHWRVGKQPVKPSENQFR